MLFLLDEYKAAYPKRNFAVLDKFKSLPKNLHEMTLSEINNVTKKWNPIAEGTVDLYKHNLQYYLEWLQTKGIVTNPTVAKQIVMPILKSNYRIFSTKDLTYYFNEFYRYIERLAIRTGKSIGKEQFFICHAAGILAFYGLSIEQIVDLDLSDIQPDGVRGYDLPLTKEDIDVLLTYKRLTHVGRNTPLIGTKYLRSTKAEGVDKSKINAPISRLTIDEDYAYLKKLLSVTNLYVLGLYDRMYKAESKSDKELTMMGVNPQWFLDILAPLKLGKTSLTAYKKDYIEYRQERDDNATSIEEAESTVENESAAEQIVEPEKPSVDIQSLAARLETATKTLAAVCAEIEDIKNQLKK